MLSSFNIFLSDIERNIILLVQVDLTAYVERHEFCFDAVLDEDVSNDEVT